MNLHIATKEVDGPLKRHFHGISRFENLQSTQENLGHLFCLVCKSLLLTGKAGEIWGETKPSFWAAYVEEGNMLRSKWRLKKK